MARIADFGNFEQVPPLVSALLAGDTAALDAAWSSGWDIEAAVALSERIEATPLVLALSTHSVSSVHWLVEHGANPNCTSDPAFPVAARYSTPDTMRYLVENGADIHARREVGGDAYMQALYGKKIEHLPVIHAIGHSVQEYGGAAFRSAVMSRNSQAVEFFLAHGVDVDFRERDQVFSDGATPVLVAARLRDMDMCRLLVAHGADVMMINRDGDRPYTIALEQRDDALATYFKSLESPDLHNVANKLRELTPYKLPKGLLDFLQGEHRRIELPDCDFGFVEFFALVDTIPMMIGRKKVLRISRETGDYTDTILVWNPKTRRLGYWDIEHEEYADIAPFEAFMTNPATYMNGILNGDY
ncbi:ankyrin repeat domain-containing protein [Burkholderia stagnalis]